MARCAILEEQGFSFGLQGLRLCFESGCLRVLSSCLRVLCISRRQRDSRHQSRCSKGSETSTASLIHFLVKPPPAADALRSKAVPPRRVEQVKMSQGRRVSQRTVLGLVLNGALSGGRVDDVITLNHSI